MNRKTLSTLIFFLILILVSAAMLIGSSVTVGVAQVGQDAWAWGYNAHGQLGDGNANFRTSVPVQVVGLTDAIIVEAGWNHNLALKSDGTVWAWGYNAFGQVGDGTQIDRLTPVQVSGVADVVAIAGGGGHSLALRSDGTVWAWGYNSYGQLGDGTTSSRLAPVQVSELTDVTAVAAGLQHSFALKSDGTVWGWGYNGAGVLGDGTQIDRLEPVRAKKLTGVMAIAAGSTHTLVLKTDGTIWGWGNNALGQLGDGTSTEQLTPVATTDLANVIAVAAGHNHSLALRVDGIVWAWGGNTYGQVGDGTKTNRLAPVQVDIVGVTAIAATGSHSLALKSDGTVWAWGYNWFGQLGDGTQTDRLTPVQVSDLTEMAGISAGSEHSLAYVPAGDPTPTPAGTPTPFPTSTPTLTPTMTPDPPLALERVSVDRGSYPDISDDGRYVVYLSGWHGCLVRHDRQTGEIVCVDVNDNGDPANSASDESRISADGRYVVFESYASNLVEGDTNGTQDVFLRDLQTGETTRVSVSSGEGEANGPSESADVSADGRYVVFESYASNLVEGDTNGTTDVFLHDRQLGETTRMSVDSNGNESNDGGQWPAISANGRYVVFESSGSNLVTGDTNDTWDIFLHDVETGETIRVSVDSDGNESDDYSTEAAISADGRYVLFTSSASNLVEDDLTAWDDIYLRDVQTGQTSCVSVNSNGDQANNQSNWATISADGRYVVFESWADNLVGGDTNGNPDVFLRDRHTGGTWRISVTEYGDQANGPSYGAALAAESTFVAYVSNADNLVAGDTNGRVDTFVLDWSTIVSQPSRLFTVEKASVTNYGGEANAPSSWPADISPDGRYAVFESNASNLVASDRNGTSDVFLRDRTLGRNTRVSVSSNGDEANSSSAEPAVSADGRYVVFESYASNLVEGDTNGRRDIFVHDVEARETTRVSVDSNGNEANSSSSGSAISADGRYVAFGSSATNLVANDTNGQSDIFLHDTQTGETIRVSVDSNGTAGNGRSEQPAISGDGRYVVFRSVATNLVANDTNGKPDIFLHDTQTGETIRASVDSNGNGANDDSWYYSDVSDDGRYVVFESCANNLVADDTNGAWDIFLHDTQTGVTTRVSVDSAGNEANDHSEIPSISGNGRYVAFDSGASNLVAGDTNGLWDAFLHDLHTGKTWRISLTEDGEEANGDSYVTVVADDSTYAVYYSCADNLIPRDTNGYDDIFVVDWGDIIGYTPEGTNVVVQPPDQAGDTPATITYSTVNSEGTTDLTTSSTGPVPPAGFQLGDPPTYYTMTTTAEYSPLITVCVSYDPAQQSDPNDLYLLHYENGEWTDITTSNDTDNGVICGITSSFSQFIISEPIGLAAPEVGEIAAPAEPLEVNTQVGVSAVFTDADVLDTHTAVWDWGDGTNSPGTITEVNGTGAVTATHAYTAAGVYTLWLTVTDEAGDSSESVFQYVVVYDPEGGFVTGGGWITSPEGAYRDDPTLTGRANFGFISKYKKGASVPTGQTQFKVADFNFHSDTYDWLVVGGARARYKGTGTINGEGAYKFMLTAVDADINPNDAIEVDRFRIKIWYEDEDGNEVVVYDNGLDAEDFPVVPTVGTTEIGGGSIVIHGK